MSAGNFVNTTYEANSGLLFPISIQPETLTLTLGGVVNAANAGAPGAGLPSASVSSGRRANGVNARLVRFTFTGTLPPGYSMNGTLTLPVLQPSVFNGYSKGQVGTYTLNGTDYDVAFVGKTAESVR